MPADNEQPTSQPTNQAPADEFIDPAKLGYELAKRRYSGLTQTSQPTGIAPPVPLPKGTD